MLLGALFAGNVPSLAGVIVLVTLRLIFSLVFDPRRAAPVRPRLFTKETCAVLFREGEALRVCSAAVAAFTAGMVRLFAGGFAIGDLVGVCFAVLICPALTYLYIGYTTATAHSSPRFVIGHAALLVSFVFALSSLSLPLGFSAATAVAAYLSMLAARRRDPLAAGVLALLFGFAAVFFFSGAHVLPTAKNNRRAVERAWDEAQAAMANVLPEDFPLPARYAHPIVLDRMIRILREGRAQSKEEALDVLKADLRALTADVQVEQEEHDEVVVIKPLFLVSDYQ